MATTVKYAFDECQSHFKDLSFNLFLVKLNRAILQFIGETDCVTVRVLGSINTDDSITITSPAAQTLTNVGTGEQLRYVIPTYVHEILGVKFANASGEYLDAPMNYAIDLNHIEFYNPDGETGWPSDVAYIEFYASKAPADLTAATDTIAIPDQFAGGVIAMILSDLYARGRDEARLQLAGWYRSEYQRIRKLAKHYGVVQRSRYDGRGKVGELIGRDSDTSIYGTQTGDGSIDGGTF